MTKAPSLVKWIFAIIAFVGGSIVAQLLQPPTSKTVGLGGITLVAQLDAAPPQSPVETTAVSIVATPAERVPAPTVHGDLSGLPNTVADSHTPVAPPARKSLTSQKLITPTDSKFAHHKAHTQHKFTQKKSVTHSVLQTTLKNQPLKAVAAPRSEAGENLSLTSLPRLSGEASNFQNIRSDLPGQFQPLKGISQKVTPRESRKVAVRSSTPFSPTSILPTEIVPAAKFKPTTGVIPPESQTRVARRSEKRVLSETKSAKRSRSRSESGIVAVTNDTAQDVKVVPANRAPHRQATQEIAKPKIASIQSTIPTRSRKVASAAVTKKPIELDTELTALRSKVRRVLKMYHEQEISVREKSAWSVMHSFIGYGVEKQVRIDHQGNRASAIGWVCFNNPCRGVRLFYLKNGEIYGRLGPGNQGHEGQFLAMLAQSRVHVDYPMKIEGQDFTVLDLVEREKKSCRPKTELTFKLIGLSHYLESNETWKDDRGGQWDIPRLIKEEMRQPIVGAACGGTHRLFGLSYAVNRRIHKGKPVDGQYQRAEIYLKDYQKYTFKMQNTDGSFSTRFFSGRGAANDIDRRLLTTGHISEWLAFSLEKKALTQPRMVQAVDYLASLLLRGKHPGWKVGPLGHALHALNIYNDRVFKNTAKLPVVAFHSP